MMLFIMFINGACSPVQIGGAQEWIDGGAGKPERRAVVTMCMCRPGKLKSDWVLTVERVTGIIVAVVVVCYRCCRVFSNGRAFSFHQ
jgi:hypothetical protein